MGVDKTLHPTSDESGDEDELRNEDTSSDDEADDDMEETDKEDEDEDEEPMPRQKLTRNDSGMRYKGSVQEASRTQRQVNMNLCHPVRQ